jgi:hypothetical protein
VFPMTEMVVGNWRYTIGEEQHDDDFVALVPEGSLEDFSKPDNGQARCACAADGVTTQSLCILTHLQSKGAQNIKFSMLPGLPWS